MDPHVWLDPEKAKQEMKAILDGFVQADPEHAEYYRKNYETYAGQFDTLDENYREVLQQVKNKELITAHEAFGYLCHAYGLEQQGIRGSRYRILNRMLPGWKRSFSLPGNIR